MRELTFAVLGAGFWGEYQIAAWGEVAGARLVAVCDRDRVRATAVAERFRIPRVYEDAEELVRSESLDFLDVVVGPEAHEQFVRLAARHGLHAICQKPLALDYSTCLRMVEVCRQAGTMLLVHENYRWQPPMRRVKQILEAGRIGRPFRAHLQFSHGDLRFFDRQPYLYEQPHFALFDMGPHLLDLARFFFGEPERIAARQFQVHPRFAGEDVVSVMLHYPRLACHGELSWRTSGYEVFIEGEQGTVLSYPDGQIHVTDPAGTSSERLTPEPYPWADSDYGFAHASIVAANRNLLAALRGEAAAETTADDNLQTMHLVFLTLESARLQQVLSVERSQ